MNRSSPTSRFVVALETILVDEVVAAEAVVRFGPLIFAAESSIPRREGALEDVIDEEFESREAAEGLFQGSSFPR